MKKITILMIMIITISSCSNMVVNDAEKVCDLTTQSREMMDKIYSASVTLGASEDGEFTVEVRIVRKAAKKQLDELEADIKEINAELDNISGKYDEDEFQILLENCEDLKEYVKNKIKEMEEAEQWVEDSIDNN